ncbi:acyltransferase family protein [Paenibacillus cymbidii]|uniref:acyltransferase family protein n=1 Tax=Paenibacillus cymbidii TaxID=1639034 RepID=UPI00108155A9|nr:acyltransferase family protein [Paenibacillus cymbidii]
MPEPVKGTGRYMPGLDGLRAIAVLAVVVYHLAPDAVPGGLLGVGVFFVLSGYLITDLLIGEWKNTGTIRLQQFWLRRARRLLPAMLLMVAAVCVWTALVNGHRLPAMRDDALGALLYVSNWQLIYKQVSYFETFGPPSPFGHFWSLAVEEQFYLLWPLILAFGLRFLKKTSHWMILTLAGAAASACLMALLYEPGLDPSRVYYGTDTRAFSLLIGAALAFVWPSRKLNALAGPKARRVLDAAGIAGIAVMLLLIWRTQEYSPFLYQGGMVLLSFVAAIAIAAIAHPASNIGKWLGAKPLRWLGLRSYGVYLWHYPVIALTGSQNAQQPDPVLTTFQLAATLGLAELSWRFVESPIRGGALGTGSSALRRRKSQKGSQSPAFRLRSAYVPLAFFILCLGGAKLLPTATASFATSPSFEPQPGQTAGVELGEAGATPGVAPSSTPSATPSVTPGAKPGTAIAGGNGSPATASPGAGKASAGPQATPGASGAGATGNGAAGSPSATPQATPKPKPTPTPAPPATGGAGQGITVIGDSVVLGAQADLEHLLPGIVVDGKLGRQLVQASEAVEQLKADGKLGDRIVIELGTNGPFTKKQMETLLLSLGDAKQIWLVNTRVPKQWEDSVNKTIAEVAADFPHASVIDWYGASDGKTDYLYTDGVHLRPEGAKQFASLIVQAAQHS